jgi:hypothetical protein
MLAFGPSTSWTLICLGFNTVAVLLGIHHARAVIAYLTENQLRRQLTHPQLDQLPGQSCVTGHWSRMATPADSRSPQGIIATSASFSGAAFHSPL